MRLVFAGTPEFAERALCALIDAGHEIKLVLTQPDRPAGRGKRLSQSPVKRAALAAGIPVYQPQRLRDPATWAPVAAADPTVMVVAAYGLILPQGLLDVPTQGCLNIHASILPRWRGAAPIQRAIEAGDAQTGITIMQMDAGLDTGAMRRVDTITIGDEETGGELHDRLAALGATAIVSALDALQRGDLPSVPQPETGMTYARKIETAERRLDWSRTAAELHDRIRAFDPVPGCLGILGGEPPQELKVWASRLVGDPSRLSDARPGQVLVADERQVVVATGRGALALTEIQRPGARRLPVADFQRGRAITVEDIFT
ncbi:MAG: methionyl-tRNA formyltransferase [Burkholderiaceae bacterium]